MDEKLKKIIIIVIGAFVLLFIILFAFSGCSKKNYSPSKLEEKISQDIKDYYYSHKEELPGENSLITLSLAELSSRGIIDDVNDVIESGTTCSGTITIENNNNYYMYSPSISCTGNTQYKSYNLKDLLLENVVTEGNGLYLLNDSYYFRGYDVNNYIIFDGLLWRITKINSDNSIRLIEVKRRESVVWDDRYNADKLSASGINDYITNNLNSRIKDTLEDIYTTDVLFTDKAKGYIKVTDLCIGKRTEEDSSKDGSTECSNVIPNQYLGLLQINEYLIASLDENCNSTLATACSNYNYLADFQNSYWTLTASAHNTNQVYKINNTVMASGASNTGMPRIVMNISENTNVTGTGTEEDPYIVTGLQSTIREK